MKRTINLLMMKMFLVLISASFVFASETESGTKNITLDSGVTAWFKIGPYVNKKVKINAMANQGNIYIEVVNDAGVIVAGGTNKVDFRTGNQPSRYKIIITNTTNQIQTVIVSYTATDDLWT